MSSQTNKEKTEILVLLSAINQVAESCEIVFELTGRSVPSNHQATITAEVKKLQEISKSLKELTKKD